MGLYTFVASNLTSSDESREAFEDWKKYDDAQENFCEPEGWYLSFVYNTSTSCKHW